MKLVYCTDKTTRQLASMCGLELSDKRVQLNKDELNVIEQAMAICKRADELERIDVDDQTSYGWARIYLEEIMDDHA